MSITKEIKLKAIMLLATDDISVEEEHSFLEDGNVITSMSEAKLYTATSGQFKKIRNKLYISGSFPVGSVLGITLRNPAGDEVYVEEVTLTEIKYTHDILDVFTLPVDVISTAESIPNNVDLDYHSLVSFNLVDTPLKIFVVTANIPLTVLPPKVKSFITKLVAKYA